MYSMRISNISICVRTEMCTNNKFVSTLIWTRCFHTDMKTSRSIVCQTNMHLIMPIEKVFKFCGKLIHFYNERISFLFYCEDGKRGAFSWLSLNADEVKQTSHLLDVCRFRLFLWQFDGLLRNPLIMFRFPPSLIVHVHWNQRYLVLLDWIVCSCPGRYSPLQSLLMFGAEFVPRSMVLSPVCTTL
jgi:hypothetical protein